MNKKWAVIFATSPLVIYEGLINTHNDLIGVSLAIVGIYFLRKKGLLARFFLLLSGLIKYITLPLLMLNRDKNHLLNKIVFLMILVILGYITFSSIIQPWYFLTIFAFLPYYEKFILRLNIFFAGLLLSYYPFIRFGDWTTALVNTKYSVIFAFFIINIIYLLFSYRKLQGNK